MCSRIMNSKQKCRNSAKYKLQQKSKTEKMNRVAMLRGRAARGGDAGVEVQVRTMVLGRPRRRRNRARAAAVLQGEIPQQ
jgi:hypothetical protein